MPPEVARWLTQHPPKQTVPEPRRIPDQRLREIVAAAPAGDDWEAALWIAREVDREHGITGHAAIRAQEPTP